MRTVGQRENRVRGDIQGGDADPCPTPVCFIQTSAIPPTMTATEPFLSRRLRLARVAGTAPIQAMKWRQPLWEGGGEGMGQRHQFGCNAKAHMNIYELNPGRPFLQTRCLSG